MSLAQLSKYDGVNALHVPLMGGLGNQIFQGAHAVSWLMDSPTSRRIVIYGESDEWLKFLNLNIEPLLTKMEFRKSLELPTIARKLVGACIRFARFRKKPKFAFIFSLIETLLVFITIKDKGIETFIFNQDLGDENIPDFKGQAVVFGYFQTHVHWERIKNLQIRESHPKSDSDAVNTTELEDNSLVVHIRLGDYLTESKFGNLGIDYYAVGIRLVFQSRSVSRVVVFSDDIETAKRLYDVSFRILLNEITNHVDSETIQWIGSKDLSNLSCLRLMSTGSFFVVANSSFSWWAAAKAEGKQPLVICPNPWFQKIKEPRNIVPSDWIRIPSVFGR